MENQENNNLNELDQLKAQYEELKQRFEQQEIVNDRLMKTAIQTNINFFTRNRKVAMIVYPILAVLMYIYFEVMGFRAFGIILVVLIAICTFVELWLTRNTRQNVVDNSDLLTLSRNMQKLKTGYSIYVAIWLFVCFVFGTAFTFQYVTRQGLDGASFTNVIWALVFMGLLLLVFGIVAYRNFVGHCNDVIRQIGTYDGKPQPKSPRTFLLFLGSMIVAFGIVILLVTFALRPTTFVRAENDISTEGKLEFWEVYADTIVSPNDTKIVMEQWMQSDSIVVMKSELPADDNQKNSRIFALKKATTQGPAISSNVMGGKPIIQSVEISSSSPNADGYMPFIVRLTPDASILWSHFTKKIAGHNAALVIDGIVVQEWYVQCEINNGQLFIMQKRTSDDELKEFCEMLVRQ
ncbi:MAG: hypothetical protein IKP45_05910 [Bacteroidales bacterium]|nr:hypothetical protein [Bacteroidales bacterium]